MTYLPFARKWRPQDFDEVVGQEHITTTLKNAISLGRIHHAYLFAGPRGIGKTSTARILSKALNCEKGPIAKPCNKCNSCQEISNGNSLDVIEIDGASNRGIDEIRNLREAVKFSPVASKFKIYIIDEVHMLTPEAFNALLKTLEEPPAHVKFIFATTEPHRLPATILSRCQRFDFRRIPLNEIIAKLKTLVKEEKLDVEEGVLLYIAKAAEGSMRDAESILDQIASFPKGKIKLKDVVENLGMIDQDTLFKCAGIVINKDTKSGLHLVDEILNSGKDAKQFLSEMLEHFRNIMVAKVAGVSEDLIELPKDAIEELTKQARSFSQGDIFYVMNVISNSMRMIKQLLPERVVLELCMVRLTSRESITSIEEILSKLPLLTKTAPDAPPVIQVTQKIDSPVKTVVKHDSLLQKKVQEESKPAGGLHTNMSIDIERIRTAWPILVKAMAVKKMSVSSYLSEGLPETTKGDIVFVAYPKELNFHKEILEEKKNKEFVEETLSQILDMKVRLQFIISDKIVREKPADNPLPPKPINGHGLKKEEPIIDTTLNIFGGRILRPTGPS